MKKKGFTLIELLVVIAIIGLLSTLSVVALNSAREKARDAKRVSDIKQTQTALELYYSDAMEYPTEATAVTLGVDNDCLDSDGFVVSCGAATTIYMGIVPSDPTSDVDHTYEYLSADGTDYQIEFTLEGKAGTLEVGAHCATPNGITDAGC